MIRLYYCRKCGNFTYFKFSAHYEYNATLRGIIYSDVVPIKLDVKSVECKVCGSHDIGYVDFKDGYKIPDLVSITLLKADDRIKAFDRMRAEFGGGILKEGKIEKEVKE